MTALETLRTRRRETAGSAQAMLREVLRPDRRLSAIPFVLVVAVVLAVGMVGVLLLTMTLQSQAFAVRDRQHAADELGYRLADLQAQISEARSSGQLGIKASLLGMRPNPHPVLLVIPDGRVVGSPTRVTGGELPLVVYKDSAQIEADVQARERADAEKRAAAEARRRAVEEARKRAAAARFEAQHARLAAEQELRREAAGPAGQEHR